MTPAQARKQRRELMREIALEHRRQARQHLAALKHAIRDTRASHKQAIRHAVMSCRSARLDARRRASELRARLLLELRVAVSAERQAARASCSSLKGEAKGHKEASHRARAELAAERQFRREMRQIERSNRARRLEITRSSRRERETESDDEVRGNIPPELVVLFERVKGRIKASDRMTRTEAFLHYAEEHPREVLVSIEDESETRLGELEKQAAAAERALKRPLSRKELEAEVPF
jgi:hypothetical protein